MKDRYILAGFSLVVVILVFWSRHHIFFWDTVQFAGRHGDWYINNGLFSGGLPEHLDSGHPPTFGIYLATLYRIFGRHLPTAHFAMLPFLLINLYYACKLGKLVLGSRYWVYMLAMLVCPFYLGQSVLVSPDLLLVTGFLASLYGVLGNQKKSFVFGSILLSVISIRGMIVLFLLGMYELSRRKSAEGNLLQRLRKTILIYLPAIILFIFFQLWHVWQTKWIGFHEDSPWSPSFTLVQGKTMVYHIGLYIWRLLDFGMIVIYLAIIFFIKQTRQQRYALLPLVFILILGLGLITVPFTGLINHRYYLPIQLVSLLWMLQLTRKINVGIVLTVVMLMAFGNLIIYPDKIAQGWDSTAAHWPYYQLEQEMYNYIASNSEFTSAIGTAYPTRGNRRFLDPQSNHNGYHPYNLLTDKYILYSNIMNDFSDEALDELSKNWTIVHSIESKGVKMILYGRE